jgi:hypothetical protein
LFVPVIKEAAQAIPVTYAGAGLTTPGGIQIDTGPGHWRVIAERLALTMGELAITARAAPSGRTAVDAVRLVPDQMAILKGKAP